MKILAIETSTEYLSIACLENNNVKYAVHDDVGIRHSEILISSISDLLDKVGWKINEIELLCVGLGPGSFTGLRIGVATVKGLEVSLKCKVIGVPSMDAIVLTFPTHKKLIAPFLDARKDKVYTCVYEWSGVEYKRKTDYLLITADEFLNSLKDEIFLAGDAVLKYKNELDACEYVKYSEKLNWQPRAYDTGILGFKRFPGAVIDAETLDPLYLHPKECNVTKPHKNEVS